MSAKPKGKNPFYVLLLIAGTLFAITACGYGAMTVRMLRSSEVTPGDKFFDTYGFSIMAALLVALAILTGLAILTDDYWMARAEKKARERDVAK